ncbi:hypothetical protein JI739_03915 [Ramlibacter sp. AW1]|uniref:Uncharacterized protein n=1 Tax=Ramlibacter aurantiacus TaxID=2801330 RepID=A0A936ZFT9_9BURK|nr:hypothetical protein [Ramlibacter aurantiacus]MBL0419488.1 hypothetical protein [Ramlibacter aurantiacus]
MPLRPGQQTVTMPARTRLVFSRVQAPGHAGPALPPNLRDVLAQLFPATAPAAAGPVQFPRVDRLLRKHLRAADLRAVLPSLLAALEDSCGRYLAMDGLAPRGYALQVASHVLHVVMTVANLQFSSRLLEVCREILLDRVVRPDRPGHEQASGFMRVVALSALSAMADREVSVARFVTSEWRHRLSQQDDRLSDATRIHQLGMALALDRSQDLVRLEPLLDRLGESFRDPLVRLDLHRAFVRGVWSGEYLSRLAFSDRRVRLLSDTLGQVLPSGHWPQELLPAALLGVLEAVPAGEGHRQLLELATEVSASDAPPALGLARLREAIPLALGVHGAERTRSLECFEGSRLLENPTQRSHFSFAHRVGADPTRGIFPLSDGEARANRLRGHLRLYLIKHRVLPPGLERIDRMHAHAPQFCSSIRKIADTCWEEGRGYLMGQPIPASPAPGSPAAHSVMPPRPDGKVAGDSSPGPTKG